MESLTSRAGHLKLGLKLTDLSVEIILSILEQVLVSDLHIDDITHSDSPVGKQSLDNSIF